MRGAMTLVTVAFLAGPVLAADDAASAAGVRARVKALEAAWNARDAGGIAAVFAPDGDLILGDSPRYSGQEAIRLSSQDMASATPPARKISISVDAIRHLSPDIAIAECTAKFSAGEPTQDRATWVMVRRQGAWQIAALRVLPAERVSK